MKYILFSLFIYAIFSGCSTDEPNHPNGLGNKNEAVTSDPSRTSRVSSDQRNSDTTSVDHADTSFSNKAKKSISSPSNDLLSQYVELDNLLQSIGYLAIPHREEDRGVKVKIDWVNDIQADFSFVDKLHARKPKYDYSFFVSPRKTDSLLQLKLQGITDTFGNIYSDSMDVFHTIVDTSLHYSIHTESAYEGCSGSRIARIQKMEKSIRVSCECYTFLGKSLEMEIVGDSLSAWLEVEIVDSHGQFNSIVGMDGGNIQIDRALFQQGILKAEFKIDFDSLSFSLGDQKMEKTVRGWIYDKLD